MLFVLFKIMDENLKYRFPEYCIIDDLVVKKDFEFNNELEGSIVLVNNRTKSIFFINESIKYFLLIFKDNKLTYKEFLTEIKTKISEEDFNEEKLFDFLNLMIKKGFIIPDDDTSDLDEKTLPQFIGYNIIETFKESDKECVCLALRESDGTKVVLKFVNFTRPISIHDREKHIVKFQQEFHVMKQAENEKYICQIYDFDKEKNLAVLEYIEGKTIKDLIKSEKLSLKCKLLIIRQIIHIISYLHASGIIHGDIHAKQFMINDKYTVKLIDFGFSNTLDFTSEVIKRGGIYYYLEPENVNSNAFNNVIDYYPSYRSEIYRIGILLYYIIYEKYPFESFSWKELSQKIKEEKPIISKIIADGQKVPSNVIYLIEKMLDKNPDNRFASAMDVKAYTENNPIDVDDE
jgi:serine/threonine-protein kinase